MIQAVNTASDKLSPETFYNQGLEVLHSVVLYWTTCTVLYNTMRIMFQRFPGLHFGGSFSVQPARTSPEVRLIHHAERKVFPLARSRSSWCTKHFISVGCGIELPRGSQRDSDRRI